MPIYEYRCRACDHEFETLQKMSDPKLVDCPQCDESALIKKISAVSFRLKGSGWYETDFKNNKNQPAQQESGKDSASESESKSNDSPDSASNSAGSDSSSSNDSKSSKSESTSSTSPSN